MLKSLTLATIIVITITASAQPAYRTLKATKKGQYTANVRYPHFAGNSALAHAINGPIERWAKNQFDSFVKDARKNAGDKSKSSGPWDLAIMPKTGFQSAKLISVRMTLESYLGGAHGLTQSVVFNFGVFGDTARRLRLGDLVTTGNPGPRINDLVMAKLANLEGADWVHSGEVKDLTPQQMQRFVIERDGLRFLFDPYEMGPYSSGPMEVKLTLTDLGAGFRREWLK